ncbi:unnamed protein product [Cladocopium goreaui]|uniref:Hemicentin-1 n=1 Tax=Cladocopium goreaui TaxID=2562237 RepID=A0A9P1D2W7_9DINO|nr:unnamed protein product [Cladocopium goreaui]
MIRFFPLLFLADTIAFESTPHDAIQRSRGSRRLLRSQDGALEPAVLRVSIASTAGIDCSWSDWSAWSFCSVTCGEGLQERKRWVAMREQQNGAPCTGASEQHGPCSLAPCAANATASAGSGCSWESWQDWSKCTASCEGGRRQRVRAIRSGNGCSLADGQQAEACGKKCEEAEESDSENCWTEWSSCSKTCSGLRTRSSKVGCSSGSQEELCNMEACGCQMSDWSDWSACSGRCQNSQASSSRKRHSKATEGDAVCNGTATETKSCDCLAAKVPQVVSAATAPVDCVCETWQDWEACSTSCGAGTRKRSRTVQVPANEIGRDCVGEDHQTDPCKGESCPTCRTSEWSSWSDCTGPCTYLSSRSIRVREPLSSGLCDKSLEEERACTCHSDAEADEVKAAVRAAAAAVAAKGGKDGNEGSQDEERINCQWGDWHDWEACTKSCNTGITRRSRDVLRAANALGSECQGENRQTQNCNDSPCPCAVGSWSDWSSCAGDCEGKSPRAVRTRELVQDSKSNGNSGCREVLEEEKACTCSPAGIATVDDTDLDTLTAADLRAHDLDAEAASSKVNSGVSKDRRVSGALELKLHDPVSFSSDPNAETAAQSTLKELIGSLSDSYHVSVSLMPTDGKEMVDCWYSLILPEQQAMNSRGWASLPR